MASDSVTLITKPPPPHKNPAAILRRRLFFRRRRLPTVRLGGGKKPRRGSFIVRIFRRVKLRWLKVKYMRMIKRLTKYYKSVVRDMVDAGATLESFQQRVLLESSFAIPVMGVSLNSYPTNHGLQTAIF